MFGFFEAIYSQLARNLGHRGETADAAGSLHGKVGDLRNYITSDVIGRQSKAPWGKNVSYAKGSIDDVALSGTTNIISITGPRIILGGAVALKLDSNNSSGDLIVKLDGTQIIQADHHQLSGDMFPTTYTSDNEWKYPFYSYSYDGTSSKLNSYPVFVIPMLPIPTSFEVQYVVSSGTETTSYFYHVWSVPM